MLKYKHVYSARLVMWIQSPNSRTTFM